MRVVLSGEQFLEVEQTLFFRLFSSKNSPVAHTAFPFSLSFPSSSLPSSGICSLLLLLHGEDTFREMRLSLFDGLFLLNDSTALVAQRLNSQGRSLALLIEALS